MTDVNLNSIESRFDRVYEQLDDIGKSLRLLASIDERTVHLITSIANSEKKISDHEKRVQTLEKKMYLIITLATGIGTLFAMIIQKVF